MLGGATAIPDGDFILADATVPAALADAELGPSSDALVSCEIGLSNGRIAAIAPKLEGTNRFDMRGGQVWPCFVDMHTHLDKGHIWPRRANPDGSFIGAIEAVRADSEANWSASDVAARMDFSLRCAYAHGTKLIRTHLDSAAPQHRISWPVFAEMRDRWAGRIQLQAVSLVSADALLDDTYCDDLLATIVENGGVLGALAVMEPDLVAGLDRIFEAATRHGLDLDFHADETGDPNAHALRLIAEAKLRHDFSGSVVVGHCCSLACQTEDEAAATIALCAEAGLAVVNLPMCNMYLQDRQQGRTPCWRGVTRLKELRAAGVPVAVASDNTRDPFYAYGDLDPVEVLREAVRILHLDHPMDGTAELITSSPARIVGRPDFGRIRVGDPADLVLFDARSWTEFLSRPQSDRTVLRDGKPIDRQLPDYRELDALLEGN